MKRKYIVLIGIVISIIVLLNIVPSNDKVIESSIKTLKQENDMIALMYETKEDSGEYEKISDNSWPENGYVFNENLSKCKNGSKITYNKDENKVYIESNIEDKCYVYFEKSMFQKHCDETLFSCQIVKSYESDSTLLFHDDDLENGAQDGSYRFSGTDPNNYVCFGTNDSTCSSGNLYRIIGAFKAENSEGYQIKLIKYEAAMSDLLGEDGNYGGSANHNGSYKGTQKTRYNYKWQNGTKTILETNLNNNFLTNIGIVWANKISEVTWNKGKGNILNYSVTPKNVYDIELGDAGTSTRDEFKGKIGLMYVSEYYYAASPYYWTYPGYTIAQYPNKDGNYGSDYDYRAATSSNWMHMGETEWTISIQNANNAYSIRTSGYVLAEALSGAIVARPTFNLLENTKIISGTGTKTDPYRIS